jgi:aminopeptidase-like protein
MTLNIINRELSGLLINGYKSGTKCFDWTVPDEWNVSDAYIEGPDGKRVVDFADHNLHLVGYSEPINTVLPLEELRPHLHTRHDMPDVIPYVTSYYKRDWGFCLTHRQYDALKPGDYHVVIDSTLEPGIMHYGELIIPGETKEEVLLSTYICHPSMANDGLSGIVVTVALAKWLLQHKRRYTYRILFLPETIGAIVYLSQHLDEMKRNTIAGFVVTCCGDGRTTSAVGTKTGNTYADRIIRYLASPVSGYYARGSDERQYCWPGVDLPVVSLMQSRYGTFPEYHTSADDMSVISPDGLQCGCDAIMQCLEIIERNRTYRVRTTCEPFMEGRGGYVSDYKLAAYCDGKTDALEIAWLTGRPYDGVEAGLNKMAALGVVEAME